MNIPKKKFADQWFSISAVVVTHHPDVVLLENLRSLLS